MNKKDTEQNLNNVKDDKDLEKLRKDGNDLNLDTNSIKTENMKK